MTKIMFVCHGNICRSTMAEFVMKDLVKKTNCSQEFVINSAATSREEIGNDIHQGTKAILRKMNIPFLHRRAIQLTRSDYDEYDFIIAMDKENLWGIKQIIGDDIDSKVHLLLSYCGEKNAEVADPWYTGNFAKTYEDVLRGCKALLAQLMNR